MQKENEYGQIIAYERKNAHLSAEQLCEGICDRVYLQRIEKGERSCDKILADVILQRIGISSKKFSYIVNLQEKELIVMKEKIVAFVDTNQREKAISCIEDYRKQIKGKGVLYLQFCQLAEIVLEWKNGEDKEILLEEIQKAWNFTKKGKEIVKLRGQRLSYFEISLAMLYVRLLEEKDEENVMFYYQEVLNYLEKHIEESDRVKWYPQIAVRLISLLKKNGKKKQAWQVTIQAIQLLQKQASVFHLLELLTFYQEFLKERFEKTTGIMPQEIKKQLSDIEGICSSLTWCYQEYQEKQREWIWDISFGESEIYLCQDVIKGRRIGMGLSQEELADGICSSTTMSRIECGKTYPKRKELVKLLEKVKWSGENYTLTAQIGNPEYHQITSQVSNLTYLGKHEEAEELLKKLEKKIPEKNIFAEQYFLNNFNTIRFALGKKDVQKFFVLIEKSLYLTAPKFNKEKWKNWHFTRAEVMSINIMSYACERVGKTEYVIKLLTTVKEFYQKQCFHLNHYQAGYGITLRNLGSLFGNLGEYEKSIQLADSCIKQALNLERIGIATTALYDRGWGMEHLWEKGIFDKQESLNYIKASYYLNLFLDRKIEYEYYREHIKKLYEEDI